MHGSSFLILHHVIRCHAPNSPVRGETLSARLRGTSGLCEGSYIVRVHNAPRIALFTPKEVVCPPPIPIDRIDVMRVTTTDSDNVDEMRIEDVWDGKSPSVHCPLSCRWTGETRFERIPEGAPPG